MKRTEIALLAFFTILFYGVISLGLSLLEKTGEAMQSQAIRMAERFGFYNHKNLDMESAVFSSREDFIEWHEG